MGRRQNWDSGQGIDGYGRGSARISADILNRLKVDAGQLTIASLIQEREAAVLEIQQLRETIDRLQADKERGNRLRSVVSKPSLIISPPSNPDALLRLKDVCALIGVGRSTIYKWVELSSFPKPIRVGARSVRWKASDLAQWRDALKS
jgi:prophage regulatory protein